ncbi:MAG: hypothetical protein LQ346_002490 [Caloplaca aetnensis]|nr:MAG: hypothetical protein LQ346_002490 [Caloplaca aetnensis]
MKAGTWNTFLHHDALASRNALESWYHGRFRLTAQFRGLSKKIKAEMERVLTKTTPCPIQRDELDGETVRILEMWEVIPLYEGSPEWTKAEIRFLSSAILQGRFKEYKSKGLRTNSETVSAARCWLYQGPDGAIRRFQSLRQPFYYKDLVWDVELKALVTELAMQPSADNVNPEVISGDPPNPETLRVLPVTFTRLMGATAPASADAQGKVQEVLGLSTTSGATDPLYGADATERALKLKRERIIDNITEGVTIVDLTDDSAHTTRPPPPPPANAASTAPNVGVKRRKLHSIRQWDPEIDGPDDNGPLLPYDDSEGQIYASPAHSDDDSDDEEYDVDERELRASPRMSPERVFRGADGPSPTSSEHHNRQSTEGIDFRAQLFPGFDFQDADSEVSWYVPGARRAQSLD